MRFLQQRTVFAALLATAAAIYYPSLAALFQEVRTNVVRKSGPAGRLLSWSVISTAEPDPEFSALMNDPGTEPVFVVVMGVSGTGKSTLGAALARAISLPYIDGDDLHPKSNVDKMTRGQPLTDEDREPWLQKIRSTAEEMAGNGQKGVVIACSALRRVYREVLRGNDSKGKLRTYFVFIDGSRDFLLDRMEKRTAHFMKSNMLDSQLATLEHPGGEEGVFVVPVTDETPIKVEKSVAWLKTKL
ncbi:hypothetical protein MIND_00056200 [Mycena indigotica]|uniref:Gluconokinase n=1 Tax=Mycena indigotica TaxID=2126181 RepID=A0A8H6TGN6_9AGAR|nr:uncharacterized protein MIND_00056200 [Mycena indigotica]KAF7315415.1 hypothetical protein MIND_00056200 [Mycena indigotica]